MERTLAAEVKEHIGQNVVVKGWISKVRNLGNLQFVLLRDRTGVVQVVVEKAKLRICDFKPESVVSIEGRAVEAPGVAGGAEIHAERITLLSAAEYDMLPFEVNRETISAGLDTILSHRVLSLRNEKVRAVFRVQQEILHGFREFFRKHDFTEINTPKIVASGTEGGTELFAVDYFDRKAYLAQSPQLYKQMMVGAGFERVFEVGHAYRAELHDTSRHMSEYVSLDVEMGFIEDETDLMKLENEFLRSLFRHLGSSCPRELEMYRITLPEINEIPAVELDEARKLLKEKFEKKSPPGNLDPEGEKLICEYAREEYKSDFLFITKYPTAKRPFYAMPDRENPVLTRSFDLLYKGLEITTGGQRIQHYALLVENMRKFGLDPDKFAFYLECFAHGMPPHGGFAIGLERLTMKVLGLSNIREATLLPRDRERVSP